VRRKGEEGAEAMGIGGIKIVHAIPGRVRVKISRLKENPALVREIQERLSAVRGIQRVEVNPITGSILVLYDRLELESLDSLLSLAESFSPFFPDFEFSELETWLASANGNAADPPFTERLATIFGSLNAKVGETTGGVDLKLLLPLTLFLLGLRGVLVEGKGVFPTWYDLFWFAFGTFFMLNPGVIGGRR
jgi:Heavy metal associated domain 2